MKLYLVRHGETVGNAGGIHQTDETPLSENGQQQVEKIAARFQHASFDVILASTAKRAQDTALAIHRVTNAPIEFEPHLREKRGPSETFHKKHEEVLHIWREIEKHREDRKFHFSDEENDWEFIQRIHDQLDAIARRKEASILVVSHGYVIRAMLGIMIYGNAFGSNEFTHLTHVLKTINTGVSICEREGDTWTILTFNDHAHLLE